MGMCAHSTGLAVTTVLSTHRVFIYFIGINGSYRRKQFHFFVSQGVGLKRSRGLDSHQGKQLEHVILDHVPDHTNAIIIFSSMTDIDGLRGRDLNVIDIVTIPYRFDQGVGKAKDQ